MLTVNGITKGYGDTIVLRDVSFAVNAGERIGLVGPNGCGKTTLLRIIAGKEPPDAGSVAMAPSLRLGYLEQGMTADESDSVQARIDAALGDLAQAEADVARLAAALSRSGGPEVAQAYDAALARLQSLSARNDRGRVEATFARLGLASLEGTAALASLSGGQKTRLGLAVVLLSEPRLLLLDEPTNHLDLEMLVWLEQWLASFPGGALVVSHDRTFLDHTVSAILELDPDTHAVRSYPGSFSHYLEAVRAEQERRLGAWRDQETEIRRMRQDIARTMEQARGVERSTTPRQPGVRRYAKKVARKALAREKKLERYLKSADRLDKPKAGWQMKLELDRASSSGRDVLRLEDLAVGYGQPLLSRVNLTLRLGDRVALVGPNGAGKTTLARTIAGRLRPLTGRVRLGARVSLGYYAQEQEVLNPERNALTTLQQFSEQDETQLRSFLHFFLFEGDAVFTPVGDLSFGERARLVLAALVAQGCNLLVLDEPINHLDIPSRARFEQALASFEGTTLAIVHDRYFIKRFASAVWRVEDDTVREYLDFDEACGTGTA